VGLTFDWWGVQITPASLALTVSVPVAAQARGAPASFQIAIGSVPVAPFGSMGNGGFTIVAEAFAEIFLASDIRNGDQEAFTPSNFLAYLNTVVGPPHTVTTTIAAGSSGAVLPQPTINVVSTMGFKTLGSFTVPSSNGPQSIAYNGTTPTSFIGCAGGTGTLSLGAVVTQPSPTTFAVGDLVSWMLMGLVASGSAVAFNGDPYGGFHPIQFLGVPFPADVRDNLIASSTISPTAILAASPLASCAQYVAFGGPDFVAPDYSYQATTGAPRIQARYGSSVVSYTNLAAFVTDLVARGTATGHPLDPVAFWLPAAIAMFTPYG
jgi:hypothetical protein